MGPAESVSVTGQFCTFSILVSDFCFMYKVTFSFGNGSKNENTPIKKKKTVISKAILKHTH